MPQARTTIESMLSDSMTSTLTSTEPASTQRAERQQRWAQGWRRWVFPYVFMAYLAATAIGVWEYSKGAGLVAGYVILAAFCACYVEALRYAFDRPSLRVLSWLVGAMLVLLAAEVPLARSDAFVMGDFIVFPAIASFGKRSWPVVGATVIAPLVVPPLVPSWHSGPALGTAVPVALTALALYAFFQVVSANRELSAARAEIARLAADNERTRISRDLHDLLGHSLTAITMKAQLARRLAGADAAAVARELDEVEALSRQALTDVRAAVSSYREVTLAGELAQARELLRASGIAAELPTATEVTDPRYDELLAWTVREAVTNVVRHAKATFCRVELGRSWVEITDDGTGTASPAGNGLLGLQERVLAAGGRIQAGPAEPKGWRLRVDLAASRDPSVNTTQVSTLAMTPR